MATQKLQLKRAVLTLLFAVTLTAWEQSRQATSIAAGIRTFAGTIITGKTIIDVSCDNRSITATTVITAIAAITATAGITGTTDTIPIHVGRHTIRLNAEAG